jgi:hypothetical protein
MNCLMSGTILTTSADFRGRKSIPWMDIGTGTLLGRRIYVKVVVLENGGIPALKKT